MLAKPFHFVHFIEPQLFSPEKKKKLLSIFLPWLAGTMLITATLTITPFPQLGQLLLLRLVFPATQSHFFILFYRAVLFLFSFWKLVVVVVILRPLPKCLYFFFLLVAEWGGGGFLHSTNQHARLSTTIQPNRRITSVHIHIYCSLAILLVLSIK